MGTLTITPQWHDNITQLEKGDLVLGGPNGKANEQPKQLAENILFIAKMLADMGITRDGVNINAGLVSTSLNKDTTVRTQQEKNNDIINILDLMTPTELAAYKSDPTTFDATEAFNRAGIFAAMLKRTLVAYGTFYTANTIVVTGDVDFSQCEIYTSATLAIDARNTIDTATIKRFMTANITFPRTLTYQPKTGTGWVAGTVGIKCTNFYSSRVFFGRTIGFESNVLIYAEKTGNVYNEYHLGWMENGKVNLLLDCDSTGWTNENNFYGGRFSHNSSEGENVVGCRHIKINITPSVINNNVFHKPSIEGDTPEFHVECGGSANHFLHARWEAKSPKLLYICDGSANAQNQATANLILGGYHVDLVAITELGKGSSFNNKFIGLSKEFHPISSSTGGYRYRNRYDSGSAVFSFFDSAEDITTAPIENYLALFHPYRFQGNKNPIHIQGSIYVSMMEKSNLAMAQYLLRYQ